MFVKHHHAYTAQAEQSTPKFGVHIPTVYERIEAEPACWQYRVLTVDPREAALPDAEQLNELGRDGWLLTGMLDERAFGKGSQVYFYFVRQVIK